MQSMQTRQSSLDSLINDIRSVLTSDTDTAEYFESELKWLDKRHRFWQGGAFRVGLVGITSSGKSTLTNALLGSELLPQAVRPSSNSLVVCKWGDSLKCIVYFKGAERKPRVILGTAIAKAVRDYGDEKNNPDNVEGVEEIHLYSPGFRLGRDVALIDTPGLDAYGHDDHEKLTLEFLLPTLDVMVLVTTCKADSDEKMRDYVCLARDHDKPVIVVQNKIDSVKPKLVGPDEISKSIGEVGAEHLRRVERVLKKACVEAVSIHQVSAIWALKQQEAASGLPEFVAGVQRELDALAPLIADGRRKQLNDWLREVITEDLQSGDPAAILKGQKAKATRLANQGAELKRHYAQMLANAEVVPASQSDEAGELIEAVAMLTSKSIDDASALEARVEQWLKSSSAHLSKLNKQLQGQIAQDCKSLNLRLADIDLSGRLTQPTSTLGFSTTRHSRTVRTEQSGTWGWFKRKVDFAGEGWGCDERTEAWAEIDDLSAFKRAVEKSVNNELKYVEQFVAALVSRIKGASRQLRKEVGAQERGIEAKIAATQTISHRKATTKRLEGLLAEPMKLHKASGVRSKTITSPLPACDLHEIEVDATALTLARLATRIARRRFLEFRNKVLFEQANKHKRDCERVLILGFEKESLGDFINRFWYDVLEADTNTPVAFERMQITDGDIHEIAVVLAGDAASEHTRNTLDAFLVTPCVVFLMIDIQQIGATRSMLARTGIVFKKIKSPIVVVAQSFIELENSDSICEALHELNELADDLGLKLAGVLVNDEKTVYSMVANQLLASSTSFKTIAEQGHFVQSLPERDRDGASKIIRSWQAMAS